METRLLSPREAGDWLGIAPQTLAEWRCSGRYGLPFVKIGGRVAYRMADLEEWVARRRQEGVSRAD